MKKMVDLDLMDPKTIPHPVVGDEEPEWEDMSPEARAKSSRAMEAFVGMVEVSPFRAKLSKENLVDQRSDCGENT